MRTAASDAVQNDIFPALIHRARSLDPTAWDQLYTIAFPHVYRYIGSKVVNIQDAEDLTEEVFAGALQSARSLRAVDESSFFAWLFQIARFKIADRLRAQYRKPAEPMVEEFDAPDNAPSPEDNLVERDLQRELREALNALTREQQEVLRLKFVLEYDNDLTAEILGKSPGAINQLQHRALNQLRKVLRREGMMQ
ncbi:MAG: sigma-70 family RNA polymerase sigma factor [Chloroflexi bacterium]|nr:sigma-70 family RNA polymerase sigma factor [Chloroflexota bacterium]